MKVPIPCEFGEKGICKNRMLPFAGVSWFKWTQGIEYTYCFTTSDYWHEYDFYTTFQCMELSLEDVIPEVPE